MLIKERDSGCLTTSEKSIDDKKKNSERIFEFDLKVKIYFILEYLCFTVSLMNENLSRYS